MDPQKLLTLLKCSIATKSIAQGKLLHSKSIAFGLQNNAHISKTLILFYISSHLFDSASLLLHTTQSVLEISLWNTLLAALSKNRLFEDALRIFCRLRLREHPKPDEYTYPSVLRACGGSGKASQGEKIHSLVMKSGFIGNVVVTSSVVGMYAKCRRLDAAVQLFDEMPERDVACWNTVISCYHQEGKDYRALEVFEIMKSCGFEPDAVTFATVFSACARVSDLERGRRIHGELVERGFELDAFVGSAVVDMYGKCRCLERAREVFEQIGSKNVVTWNAMIGGYSLKGESLSCLELFSRMHQEGIRPNPTTISSLLIACSRTFDLPQGKFVHGYLIRNSINFDVFVGSSLIDLYFKCGSVRYAESIFKAVTKDTVAWNVMISGYVAVGSYFKALNVLCEMRKHCVRPDAFTFTGALSACTQLSALEKGKEIHQQISDHGLESNGIVMTALLDMYAKCGGVKEAEIIFDKLHLKDLVSWTSMILAYGSHGQASEALQLFREMQNSGVKPDRVTFLAVLSACSHGGLVDEGCYYFKQMTQEHGIKPSLEHYSCLIDLLGRSGRLQEAYDILQSMQGVELDAGLLGSLFSACSLHKNLELGENVAKLLIEINADDHSTYVVLANIYAAVGEWDKLRKVRAEMKDRGLRKNPGCSWIEVDKKIHQFFVEDDSHQQAEVIHECLKSLLKHMGKRRHRSQTLSP